MKVRSRGHGAALVISAIAFAAVAAVACGPDSPANVPSIDARLQPDAAPAPDALATDAPAPDKDAPDPFAYAFWSFDFCHSENLEDSNGNRNPAIRTPSVGCVSGVSSLGLAFAADGDMVTVPEPHSFSFAAGFTLGAWINPSSLDGTKTIFRWGSDPTRLSTLRLESGKLRLDLTLDDGRTVLVFAETDVRIGTFQHVAATFDGIALVLYLEGIEVGRVV